MYLAEMVVKLEPTSQFFEYNAHFLNPPRPALEDGYDVTTLFHRNDSHVIFLINPNKEFPTVCTEYTPAIWPISSSSCCSE
mmetsp:Transcript_51716/g.43465  ORF Transcript_51716/g.43465 Transcript_51716/m.43465 type:complete len:81 (-) Transcript_51716:3298-3540(-)